MPSFLSQSCSIKTTYTLKKQIKKIEPLHLHLFICTKKENERNKLYCHLNGNISFIHQHDEGHAGGKGSKCFREAPLAVQCAATKYLYFIVCWTVIKKRNLNYFNDLCFNRKMNSSQTDPNCCRDVEKTCILKTASSEGKAIVGLYTHEFNVDTKK